MIIAVIGAGVGALLMELGARSGYSSGRSLAFFFAVLGPLLLLPATGRAADDTLLGALARAYQTNPALNAERARQRGTDENVPIALSGYRPRVDFGLTPSLIAVRNLMFEGDTQSATLRGYTAQLQINQILFNGFKTAPGGGLRALRPRDLARRRAIRSA